MNGETDRYYYKKDWIVIREITKKYYICHVTSHHSSEIIREKLNWFEAKDLQIILNKLHGK